MAKVKKSESISQPEMNLGLVGHVDHGKTTLTQRLSGRWTDTHSEELKRGITIRLGYADSTFRKCPKCKGTVAFTTEEKCKHDGSPTLPLRTISFVDAPGHESLMATMLAGTMIIDGALLLIAANEVCPQPQTREHLQALQICGISKVIVIQNKVDVVSTERATKNHEQIEKFLEGTAFKGAPIIPVSAQRDVNVDAVIEAIQTYLPTPKRDPAKSPMMIVARSFDVNKPGITPDKLQGGVLGGSLKEGILKVGDRIEVRPGRVVEEQNQIVAKPLFGTIKGLMTGGTPVDNVGPGGSIGVLTDLDPGLVHADAMAGNIVGTPGKLPPIWNTLKLKAQLLERVVGSVEDLKVNPITKNEMLMLNVNSSATVGIVTDLDKGCVHCRLKKPVCADVGERVTISRRVGTRFRLIGYGLIQE